MKNLKMRQKFAVMSVIAMVPFAGVTYKMASSIQAMGLDAARLELQGLEYFTPALTLVKDLQLHRGMTNAALNGAAAFDAARIRKTADIEGDIRTIDEIDRRLGATLGTSARWATVRANALDLLTSASTLTEDDSFARHSSLIAEAIGLVVEIGHRSRLSQDPDMDRKRLVDVLIFDGPELAESLARARGVGVGALAPGKTAPEQLERLKRDFVLIEYLGARVDGALTDVLSSNAGFKARLERPSEAASQAVLGSMADVGMLARGERSGPKAGDYFTRVTRGVDALVELQIGIVGALHASLTDRVSALRLEVGKTLGVAAVGLLLVGVIGFLLIRDVTVTLGRVVEAANGIAIGDLTMPANLQPRNDELGLLAQQFAKMVAALKETVGVAERIAAGDLAVTVIPRSERDVLGHALANMVERLSFLVGEVQRSGVQVNTSVSQIAATSREQQATASEIAATTTEIGATSREIAATSKELVKTMNEVAGVAEHSAMLATQGQVGVARMEATMRQVMEAAGSINTKLGVLNERAGGITQVVTTITKVADQTNLLSLNAAIEAEKAGEYGRGFAVVATEIRRLADQTAIATYDIDQMVKEIQSAVSAGVMGMDVFAEEVRRGMQEVEQVGDQLTQIIQQVQTLPPRFDVVNDGMQAQASGAEQITQALSQLGDAVHQTVESLRESNQAIDGLNDAATGMRSGTSRFTLAA